ncbi:MAG: tetratricopeptide repeat protein [Methanomassiliicoccales archaeon]|nr:tetratricopeptide repeat protein [Methanomassiliicoccales archaeon]
MDGEKRAVSRTMKSLELVDKHHQANEADRAKAELDRARAHLESIDLKSCARPDEYRAAAARLSNAYLESSLPIPAKEVLLRLTSSVPSDRNSALLLVSLYRRQGMPEDAVKVMDDFISRNPKDRLGHVARAELLESLGHLPESFQALLKALEVDPLEESTYELILEKVEKTELKASWKGRKASALLHKEKPETALAEIETALSLAPQDTGLMMIKVDILEELQRLEEAQDLLEEVLIRDRDNPRANLKMARQAHQGGDDVLSLEHYKRMLRTDPESDTGWNEVAALLFSLERYEESLLSYERLREVSPEDSKALYGRCTVLAAMNDRAGFDIAAADLLQACNDPTAHIFVADTLIKMEDEAAALEVLGKAQKAFPKQLDIMDRRRSILLKQSKFQEVLALSEEQLAIKPDHLPALRDKGTSELSLGRVTEAIKTLEKALKSFPDDPELLDTLKESYKQAGRDKDVADVCDRLLKLDPNNTEALFDKAVATDRLGRKEEAIALYGQVLTLDHNDVDASKGIAVVLFSLEKYEDALARAVQGSLHDPGQLVLWRIQADSLFMLKRFEEAVQAYNKAIALAPQDRKAIYQKGLCLESLRRFEEAIVCYDQALSLDLKDKNVWISKGIALEWLERFEEALGCYDQAILLEKEGRFVHARRGQVLAKLTRYEEAVQSFDKALETGPKDLEVLAAKKSSLKFLGRNEDIIKVCDRIVKLDPKNKVAWIDRGVAQFRLNNHPEAVRSYDRALEIEPGDMQVLQLKRNALVAKGDAEAIKKVCEDILRIDPRNKSALIDKAGALEKLGRLEEALATFSSAIMLDESDPLLYKGKGRVLMAMGKYGEAAEAYDIAFTLNHDVDSLASKGRAMLMMRNYEMALNLFEQCVSLDSSVASYHSDRGRALASLNRLQEAVEAFDKALTIDRSDAQTWKYKGNALYRLGEMENALLCFNRAMDLGVDEFGIYKLRGKVLEEMGRHEDAMDSYAKALALEPSEASVLESMGLLEDKMGNPEKGFALLEKSLSIDPRNRHAWMERADLAERLKRDDDVVRSYDNAIGLDPSDPAAWNGKGFALLRLGKYEQARRGFEKALELNPNMTSATEGLRMADGKHRESQVSEMAGKVLEFQYRNGRRMGKEEVFRECNVPYQMLDDVFAYIDQREYVDPAQLPDDECTSLEMQSRTVLRTTDRSARSGQGGLSLSDVYSSLPERDIDQARRVLGYIEGVNDIDFTYVNPDQGTEKLLRTALNMPEEKRNLFSLMEGLNIGVYKARNIIAIMGSLKAGERPAPMPRSKGQRAASATRSTDDLFVEQPKRKKQTKADAVFLPDDRSQSTERADRDGLRLFGSEEKELYDTFYPPKPTAKKPEKADDMDGRRCLFHGALAVSACPNCNSMLCKECLSAGKCPRCGHVLGERPTKMKAAEEPEKKVPEAPEPEDRDWSRL